MMTHPVVSRRPLDRIERDLFTDTLVAHTLAYRDFLRAQHTASARRFAELAWGAGA